MDEWDELQHYRCEVSGLSDPELLLLERKVMSALPASATRTAPTSAQVTSRWRGVARRVWWVTLPAAAAAMVALVVLEPRGGMPTGSVRSVSPAQSVRLVSVAQVLDLAAEAARNTPDVTPRTGQYLVYSSLFIEPSSFGDGGIFLEVDRRTTWVPADGRSVGAVRVEHLAPAAYPGSPVPSQARAWEGRVEVSPLCPDGRTRASYLSALPTDVARMRAYLEAQLGGKVDHDQQVWKAATELLRENHLPAAQRAAVFGVIEEIPGVVLVRQAVDAADRRGVAVGLRDPRQGIERQIVFQAGTFQYLGERAFVVDAAVARAPAGAEVAASAELSVGVADHAPTVSTSGKASSCAG